MEEAQLRIKLTSDGKGVATGIRDAIHQFSTLDTGITEALGSAGGILGSLTKIGTKAGPLAIMGALVEGFREVTNYAMQIHHIANSFDTDTKEAQQILFASNRLTGSETGFAGPMSHIMQARSQALLDPTSEMAHNFRQIGISMEQLERLNPWEILQKIAEGLKSGAINAVNMSQAMAVMGREARALLPQLKELPEVTGLAGRFAAPGNEINLGVGVGKAASGLGSSLLGIGKRTLLEALRVGMIGLSSLGGFVPGEFGRRSALEAMLLTPENYGGTGYEQDDAEFVMRRAEQAKEMALNRKRLQDIDDDRQLKARWKDKMDNLRLLESANRNWRSETRGTFSSGDSLSHIGLFRGTGSGRSLSDVVREQEKTSQILTEIRNEIRSYNQTTAAAQMINGAVSLF